MHEKRFTMREDGDGTWAVVDAENGGSPATVGQRRLAALPETEAKDATELLNMTATIRARKPKPPSGAQVPHPFLLPIR